MALQVDIKVILPLAGAGWTRLEPRHRDAVHLERHQQIVHRARAVGDRHHQAGAVAPRGGRHGHGLGQADDGKAGAVVRLVLHRMRDDVQRKLAVVEQARGLDIDELQRELVQLRQRKRELSGAPSVGEPPDTEKRSETPDDYLN